MMKVRLEFSLILCGSVALTSLLLTLMLSRSFAGDQESYLNDLQSTIALARKWQLESRMGGLYARAETWGRTLKEMAQKVKEEGALAAEMLSAGNELRNGWTLDLASAAAEKNFRWIGHYGKRVLALTFPVSVLEESPGSLAGTRFTLVDAKENMFASHGGAGPRLKDLSRTPAGIVQTKRQTGESEDLLVASTQLATIFPTTIAVSVPWSAVGAAVDRTYRQSAFLAMFCLLLFITIGLGFAARLTRPLKLMTEQAAEVARGNFGARVSSGTNAHNEIGILARSFNRMSEDLYKFQNELRKKERLAALGQFSAGIAHEVKNPLAGILANAQVAAHLLKEAGDMVPKDAILETLTAVQTETRRATGIVTELMHFARQDKPPTEVADLAEALRHSVSLIQAQATTHGVTLRSEIPEASVWCKANPNQLHQVVLNFSQNAMHAMRATSEKTLTLRLTKVGTQAVIEVTDTGHGMSQEVIDHLFEPFFTTKPAGEGTGLGLAVCHGIIQNHGGTVVVETSPGRGTTFRISLPLS